MVAATKRTERDSLAPRVPQSQVKTCGFVPVIVQALLGSDTSTHVNPSGRVSVIRTLSAATLLACPGGPTGRVLVTKIVKPICSPAFTMGASGILTILTSDGGTWMGSCNAALELHFDLVAGTASSILAQVVPDELSHVTMEPTSKKPLPSESRQGRVTGDSS